MATFQVVWGWENPGGGAPRALNNEFGEGLHTMRCSAIGRGGGVGMRGIFGEFQGGAVPGRIGGEAERPIGTFSCHRQEGRDGVGHVGKSRGGGWTA